jgi:hypothetical protein
MHIVNEEIIIIIIVVAIYTYNCLINERIENMNTYIYWTMRMAWKKEMKEVELRMDNDDGEYWSMRKEKLLIVCISTGIKSAKTSDSFDNRS